MSFFPFQRIASVPTLSRIEDHFEKDIKNSNSISLSNFYQSSEDHIAPNLLASNFQEEDIFLDSIIFNPSSIKVSKLRHSSFTFTNSKTQFDPLNLMFTEELQKKSNSASSKSGDSFPFLTPFSRSQSAALEDKNKFDLFNLPKSNSYNLAIRRPPAKFSNNDSPMPSIEPLNFFSAVRSVPVSRHNSDELDSLLKDLDLSDGKEVEFYSQTNKNGIKDLISSEAPLNESPPNTSKLTTSNQLISPVTSAFSQSIDDIINPQNNFVRYNEFSKRTEVENYEAIFKLRQMEHATLNLAPKAGFNFEHPFNAESNREGPNIGFVGHPNQGKVQFPKRRNFTSLPLRSSIPCRYFQTGYCARGNHCHYSHNISKPDHALGNQLRNRSEDDDLYRNSDNFYNTSNFEGVLPYSFHPPSRAQNLNELGPNLQMKVEPEILSLQNESGLDGKLFDDLSGELYYICKDQYGCRFLQKILEEGDPDKIQKIVDEINPNLSDLMIDPFGNYLCQKLMDVANLTQFTELIKSVSLNLPRISLHVHGTRVVQKTLGFLERFDEREANEAISLIIGAFKRNVVTMIKDLNGNHVVQKCVNILSSKNNQFVYDSISDNCIAVATHKHGCCVIQKCFDRANDYQRDQLVISITQNALSLVQDPYGNYVIQHVIDLANPAYNMGLIKNFFGHVKHLSVQKFSSNVIEKCIRMADNTLRHQLINEIMRTDDLGLLIDDSYANYVVQTSLDFAEHSQRETLINRIKPILLTIKNSPHIKGIQNRIMNPESRHFRRPSGFDLSPLAQFAKSRYNPQMYQLNSNLPARSRANQGQSRQGMDFNYQKEFNDDCQ